MTGIVLVCLLIYLINSDAGLLIHQPVVRAYFDLVIEKEIQAFYKADLRDELAYLKTDLSKVLSSCLIKSKKHWSSQNIN